MNITTNSGKMNVLSELNNIFENVYYFKEALRGYKLPDYYSYGEAEIIKEQIDEAIELFSLDVMTGDSWGMSQEDKNENTYFEAGYHYSDSVYYPFQSNSPIDDYHYVSTVVRPWFGILDTAAEYMTPKKSESARQLSEKLRGILTQLEQHESFV